MADKLKTNLILYEIKKNGAEILSAFYIILIVLFIFVFKIYDIISFFACLIILFVGIEKNASLTDRVFALTICFTLTVGFMFL